MIVGSRIEAQQRIGINFGVSAFVDDVQMGLHLVFSLESNVALRLTLLVRTQEVRAGKMDL